jgi:hypothetical protein
VRIFVEPQADRILWLHALNLAQRFSARQACETPSTRGVTDANHRHTSPQLLVPDLGQLEGYGRSGFGI